MRCVNAWEERRADMRVRDAPASSQPLPWFIPQDCLVLTVAFDNENIILVMLFYMQEWPAGNRNYIVRAIPQLAVAREQGDHEKGDETRGKRWYEIGEREMNEGKHCFPVNKTDKHPRKRTLMRNAYKERKTGYIRKHVYRQWMLAIGRCGECRE